jgi:hypothetical protein
MTVPTHALLFRRTHAELSPTHAELLALRGLPARPVCKLALELAEGFYCRRSRVNAPDTSGEF